MMRISPVERITRPRVRLYETGGLGCGAILHEKARRDPSTSLRAGAGPYGCLANAAVVWIERSRCGVRLKTSRSRGASFRWGDYRTLVATYW
jgi:hypothetical protein